MITGDGNSNIDTEYTPNVYIKNGKCIIMRKSLAIGKNIYLRAANY